MRKGGEKTMIKYKTVDLRTPKGIKHAEQLKSQGWVIGAIGFHTIQFYKSFKEGKDNDKDFVRTK